MAEQSYLAKLGMRLGTLGSAAYLAIAAPLATGNYNTSCHTDAARVGEYYDRTVGAEKFAIIAGGKTGPIHTRSGTVVNTNYTGIHTCAQYLIINGLVGTIRGKYYNTAGVNRWAEFADTTAETGTNLGSLYVIQSYDDAGASISSDLEQFRQASGSTRWRKSVTISTGAVSANITVASNVATNRQFSFQTVQSNRWIYIANNVNETGANAGSNAVFQAYDDSAVFISSPISITRVALGVVTLARPVSISAGTLTGAENISSNTPTWSNAATNFCAFLVNMTDTASTAATLFIDYQIAGVSRYNLSKQGVIIQASVDDLTSPGITFGRTFTLTGNITDVNHESFTNVLTGQTITRLNWIELDNPTGTATVTDACVMYFDAAAGTHKCIAAGTTKITPATVNGWVKVNVNGTIYYANGYTSKTT